MAGKKILYCIMLLSMAWAIIMTEPATAAASEDAPAVLSYYPAAGTQVDEFKLRPQVINGSTRYFLSVQWQDPEDKLDFNLAGDALSRLKTSTVYASGGSQTSMVDTEFITWIENMDGTEQSQYIEAYLYNSGTDTLYIPVKLLRSQTAYTATLNEDIVKFEGGQGNTVTAWSFSTMDVPAVMNITPGSVVEDYTSRTKVYIEGSFFSSSGVDVMFNDEDADDVDLVTVNGDTRLEVDLPNDLEPGVYNITVVNDENHQQTLYSAFSVVKGTDTVIPQDGQRTRSEKRLGNVVEIVNTSEAVLEMNSRYRDRSYLEIDLDELMGDKVFTRTISFEGRRGDCIDVLKALSGWADITVYGLTLDSAGSRDDITLQLGRADSYRSAWLSSMLRGRARLSDFIEVGGTNYRVNRVQIDLPFYFSEGENLKVLRFDEMLRNWQEVPFIVDRLEQRVSLYSTCPGIFVVVE